MLAERFEAKEGKIKTAESYSVGAKDFRTELIKIKNSDAEVLFIWGQPGEMVPILSQIKELDIQIPIVTTSVLVQTTDLKSAGLEIAEGVIYTDLRTSLENSYLNKEYKKRYNEDAGLLAKLGYDVVMLITGAMQEVGTDSTMIKDYLYLIKDFPGASGTMSFDEDGTVVKDFDFKIVKNGEFVPYEK